MPQLFRCFAEKKPGFDVSASKVYYELTSHLSITGLSYVRVFNRYDVEGIDEDTFIKAKAGVFSEPQSDFVFDYMPDITGPCRILAVESLPGQYDQRADSCSQCIELMSQKYRPTVRTAVIYIFGGNISNSDFDKIKTHIINPVEAREASLEKPLTLKQEYDVPYSVDILSGLTSVPDSGIEEILKKYALAMDSDDLKFLRDYFKNEEHRDPTITEVRMIDTYWSDHCRHTTFLTELCNVKIEDEAVNEAFGEYLNARTEVYNEKIKDRPVTLMDIATIGAKLLKKRGILKNLDESEEINACSVKVRAKVDGKDEDWLLMFKNETHNHPTEIEPFGGAATCLGGAIRDPLSGRAYVYQAMRVTGAGDPTVPLSSTLPGKLPQRQICTTAASGYSSYGNQIGLATGLVHEVYHPGYVAKRLEIGAVCGAAPASNVVRKSPEDGDIVILLGGRTGRDGCGGATGSSKSHTGESLKTCGAEVQKGNPLEERKIQRLFRDPVVTGMIKRCNDFGAGGVSVAVGELADGLYINLDKVPKKYEGLDGTELAISESQERMAVVVSPGDADMFIKRAALENLDAAIVARVTKEPRLKMEWNKRLIVDVSREFLNSNGAPKKADIKVNRLSSVQKNFLSSKTPSVKSFADLANTLNICLERGLVERFDSTIGASSVLMPFGGKNQLTPSQVMAAKLPVLNKETSTASVMSFGFDPYLSSENPFEGASAAVVESVAKLVAAGCSTESIYLTLQEYFEKPKGDPARLGKPFSALLGAFMAQKSLGIAAIGGKDSMSGSFNDLDVPPTLVSFAISPEDIKNIISPEFKTTGSPVYLISPKTMPDGGYDYESLKETWSVVEKGIKDKNIISAWALTSGGVAEGIMKMAVGNDVGFEFSKEYDLNDAFTKNYGAIIVECKTAANCNAVLLGRTVNHAEISDSHDKISIFDIKKALESKLEKVYPTHTDYDGKQPAKITFGQRNETRPAFKSAKPLAIIPVFPGTNCEYDTEKALRRAGADVETVIIRNMKSEYLKESALKLENALRRAQMLVIPGGFSGGDEPDGSGKFIAAFLRNPSIKDAIHALIKNRDGLILGICNGFQALIKLGLVPFGDIKDVMDDSCPTLTYNLIGRHQSRYVCTRVSSVKSPWLLKCEPGEIHAIPISHGEGRFMADEQTLKTLMENGQIAFQYVDPNEVPSMDILYNPNGSVMAIEGITSPDGRILGKMGHTERYSEGTAGNISGNKYQPLFEGGVSYFK